MRVLIGDEWKRMHLYDRATLVEVLVYHQPTATSGCICGWKRLGASHPEHVADMYERSLRMHEMPD